MKALHGCAQQRTLGFAGISKRPPPSPNRTVLDTGSTSGYGQRKASLFVLARKPRVRFSKATRPCLC